MIQPCIVQPGLVVVFHGLPCFLRLCQLQVSSTRVSRALGSGTEGFIASCPAENTSPLRSGFPAEGWVSLVPCLGSRSVVPCKKTRTWEGAQGHGRIRKLRSGDLGFAVQGFHIQVQEPKRSCFRSAGRCWGGMLLGTHAYCNALSA